jgi:branched-chain amino acid aminotransferase
MSGSFSVHPNPQPASDADRAAMLDEPGFGRYFTDHMATATWTASDGWHDRMISAYQPFSLEPAAAVLHYAQEIFEGLKAYRHGDSVWLFRPEKNAARFIQSARRMAMPELSSQDFLSSIETLVRTDSAWVPAGGEKSLYIRPFMFASEVFLGVRPAAQLTYCVIASPSGPYFSGGLAPVSIWLTTQYARSAPGGTGGAKTGGNYAGSLIAQSEAADHGCDQVLFADGAEHAWLEELGGMNVVLITDQDELITPPAAGTILNGVVRDSVLTLGGDRGLKPVERPVAIAELLEDIDSGRVAELFACGTAAQITPIGRLKTPSGEHVVAGGGVGEHTAALRETLLDIQLGRVEDRHGWLHQVC